LDALSSAQDAGARRAAASARESRSAVAGLGLRLHDLAASAEGRISPGGAAHAVSDRLLVLPLRAWGIGLGGAYGTGATGGSKEATGGGSDSKGGGPVSRPGSGGIVADASKAKTAIRHTREGAA